MENDPIANSPANGLGAAALLAAGIGGFILGVLAIVSDAFTGVSRALNFWNPTGPLSGVTDLTILGWLLSWWVLSRLWRRRNLPLRWVGLAAVLLFVIGLLLTFPPFMDLLQGGK
ncbi:MAG: hypothetical protein ACREU2_19205 [Steroidobacteraceae bacterium]